LNKDKAVIANIFDERILHIEQITKDEVIQATEFVLNRYYAKLEEYVVHI
jgi:hypothetical protein